MAVSDKLKQRKAQAAGEQPSDSSPSKKGAPNAQEKVVVSKRVKAATEKKGRREKFERIRMWVSVLTSMTMKDRGKIPDDIGDNILISNNMYTTKLYMTSIVRIVELSLQTPITLVGCIREALKKDNIPCICDVTFKNEDFDVRIKDAGLQSRIQGWENSLESDISSARMKERAARCLYTVKVAESGSRLMKTRMYLQLSAKTGTDLDNAEKCVYRYLNSIECTYMPIYSDVQKTLEYIALIADSKDETVKDVAPIITSYQTLAEMFPNCGSANDRKGYYVGVDILKGLEYYIDFGSITSARNIYVVAPSGVGKTVLAGNMAQSALESGSAGCFMDIKGNEYNNLVNSVGGYVVSLRQVSTEFINSWIMRKEDVDDAGADAYFKQRYAYSKRQMTILSGITDRQKLNELEELLDGFHDSLYVSLGVLSDNRNTWDRTLKLHPYDIYDTFVEYMTPEMRSRYPFSKELIGNLRIYMSRNGSKSFVFKREFDYASILKSRAISFDFGILAEGGDTTDVDLNLFRLKFLYMRKLNSEFVTANYALGRRTFKILEESQIVSSDILRMYVEEYTLRRSQMQDTILLGNSVSALMDKELAKPIIENTRCLFVGALGKEARNKVIEEFGIPFLKDLLVLPGSKPEYANTFVCYNMMQTKRIFPLIKVIMDKDKKYKVFTPVKEENQATGIRTER